MPCLVPRTRTGSPAMYTRTLVTSPRLGVSCARTRAYTCKWPRIYVYTRFVTSFHPLPHPGRATPIFVRSGKKRRVVQMETRARSPRRNFCRDIEYSIRVRSRSNFETELDLNDSSMPTRIFGNGISWLVRSARNSFNLSHSTPLPSSLLSTLLLNFLWNRFPTFFDVQSI